MNNEIHCPAPGDRERCQERVWSELDEVKQDYMMKSTFYKILGGFGICMVLFSMLWNSHLNYDEKQANGIEANVKSIQSLCISVAEMKVQYVNIERQFLSIQTSLEQLKQSVSQVNNQVKNNNNNYVPAPSDSKTRGVR